MKLSSQIDEKLSKASQKLSRIGDEEFASNKYVKLS